MTLIYTAYYRSSELGNWQKGEQREREINEEQFEGMKASCTEIGMTYSEKSNEFWLVHTDRLHATKITVA